MHTVKQLSKLAGVTVRTLHHYDEIGLLHPSQIGVNGYRYYDDAAVLRLQQILFYREIGLELAQIKDIVDSPDFDVHAALHSHRETLQERINRLHNLIHTVDNTIQHLRGENDMTKKAMFEAFGEAQQKDYERQARLQYGPDIVNESVRRWASYSKEKQAAVMEEAGQVYQDIVAAMEAGKAADDDDVKAILDRWQDNLRHFYEPTLEIMRGLGEMYEADPQFKATFTKFHPDLAEYLRVCITQYVDDLETTEIERMLAEDDARRSRLA